MPRHGVTCRSHSRGPEVLFGTQAVICDVSCPLGLFSPQITQIISGSSHVMPKDVTWEHGCQFFKMIGGALLYNWGCPVQWHTLKTHLTLIFSPRIFATLFWK